MPDVSPLPALFVITGLVHGLIAAAPVPPQDTAEAQLRAINHRFVHAGIDGGTALLEALTHDDFVQTRADGAWRSRAEFVAQIRRRAQRTGARIEDQRVRLFGPVAVVHGLFVEPAPDEPPHALRYTDVYLWSGTAWRLVSAQDTPVRDGTAMTLTAGTAPVHTPWSGQDPGGDDSAVLQAPNDQYVRAFREADVAWYGAHLAPDYMVVNGDGSWHDRASALAQFALPTFATSIRSFPVGKVTVRRFGDVALIHAENDYALKDGRRGISRYTDIWHRRDGRWLCLAAHITVFRAPSH
jgi:ketosteroid isomerase-like protein